MMSARFIQFPPAPALPRQFVTTIPDNREDTEREWMASGMCTQTDPDAFFPEKGGSNKDAKRVCAGCDVRTRCLAWALEHNEVQGIWGGLSPLQRRRLTRGAA